jgi:hypothetical protein
MECINNPGYKCSKDVLKKQPINLQIDELSYIYLLRNAHNLIKEHLIYEEADSIEEYQSLLYEDEFEEVDSNEIDELFANSNLPDSVDKNFVNDLLIKIRKNIYNI